MKWLKRYKFDPNKITNDDAQHLKGKNLSKFKYSNIISEEEFLNGKRLLLINNENNCCEKWSIRSKLIIKDLKEIRKQKLNKLNYERNKN